MSDVSLLGSYGGAGGAGLMFRNKLINGNFDIWQRGTSQTTGGYGSDDRWRNDNSGSTKTHSQEAFSLGQTDVPGNPKYFSRTVVSSVAGASNYVVKSQKIEGVETLAGKKATFSFWAKADGNKNIAIEFFQNFAGGSDSVSGIGAQKIALTSSWQKFEISVDIPSVAGKTVGIPGNDNFTPHFWFDAGSNFDARTDGLGQQSGTFDIAQVQLEEGPVATPFEHRPIGMELSLCQRYCYVITSEDAYAPAAVGQAPNSSSFLCPVFPPVPLRARVGSVSTAGLWRVLFSSTSDTSISISLYAYNSKDVICLNITGVSTTAGVSCLLTANNSVGAKIILDAEL